MDFFGRQQHARRRTAGLAFLFGLAVLGTIGATYALVRLLIGLALEESGSGIGPIVLPEVLGWTVALTGALIAICSLIRMAQLADGGEVVATGLGARRVPPDSREPRERRLLNVVEEMALASGTPVPAVFVMDDERAINAFAAGWSPANAVVCVTRGACERLGRDELQGVVGHEFSHILNGDMRLNIQLIGWLFGILALSVLGRGVIEVASHIRGRKSGGIVLFLLVAGGGLWLVGSVGVLFGRMIQAAVSRQREHLADASAVQFTRNPLGLANALKRIAAHRGGGRIVSPEASVARHLFFAEASESGLFDTHPALPERIRMLDPSWDGDLRPFASPAEEVVGEEPVSAAEPRVRLPPLPAAAILAAAGVPAPRPRAVAARILVGLAPGLVGLARTAAGARAVLYAMLSEDRQADGSATARAEQARALEGEDPGVLAAVAAWRGPVAALRWDQRLALLDLAAPALRGLPRPDAKVFFARVETLAQADASLTLFEYTVLQVLRNVLRGPLGETPAAFALNAGLRDIAFEASVLLSAVARWGEGDGPDAEAAFRAGAGAAGADGPALLSFLPPQQCGLDRVDRALPVLRRAGPALHRRVLEGCLAALAHDGRLDESEAELCRAVSAALDVPMAPLVALDEDRAASVASAPRGPL